RSRQERVEASDGASSDPEKETAEFVAPTAREPAQSEIDPSRALALSIREGAGRRVDLRISSRARRVTQRANGAWLFLFDASGHRYAPQPDPSAVPLDVRPGRGCLFHKPTMIRLASPP